MRDQLQKHPFFKEKYITSWESVETQGFCNENYLVIADQRKYIVRKFLRKDINIGIAVALPTGNLIVPVIKKADQLNLLGITKELNRLANAARENNLKPDDIQGGTFSVSNFGSFKNVWERQSLISHKLRLWQWEQLRKNQQL